jgi:peptidoglycan/xylan/chitin deacetylase (PgdA/CDA1 family)
MIIVNYHEISARRTGHRYATTRQLFAAQIDALIEEGFSFVTPADLLLSPPEDRPRQCAITFDDGRLGAYEHGARILRERRIKATYFVCPDWLEKKPATPAESYSDFMTWDHVAKLAEEGHVIGSHGKSHLPFFEIDTESAAREVSESKRLIEQRLAIPCEHFASPWGQVDKRIMTVVREGGYKTLATTVTAPNKIPYDVFRLRRLDASRYRSRRRFHKAIRASIDAHARFDVAVLALAPHWTPSIAQTEALARFDLVDCLDERAYELCLELGLPCRRPGSDPLPSTHREITFTRLTLREAHLTWTYLSSFLPGTRSARSHTRSRISTRP